MIFKTAKMINSIKFICMINILNMLTFAIIEYVHIIAKVSVWDNKDMIAALIGIIIATSIYFRFRKSFIR